MNKSSYFLYYCRLRRQSTQEQYGYNEVLFFMANKYNGVLIIDVHIKAIFFLILGCFKRSRKKTEPPRSK